MDNTILREVFKNAELTKEELDMILPKFKKVAFKKNEYLLKEGSIAQYYYFMESGFARSYVMDVEGNDITTSFFSTAKIVIDWPSFFLRSATRENIQALTDCTCWQLDFDKFQHLFHSIKAFREAGRTLLVQSYFELKQKSISMISDQAKDRYLQLLQDTPEVIQNVSLKHIATYLGITDTSLSRIRKEITKV